MSREIKFRAWDSEQKKMADSFGLSDIADSYDCGYFVNYNFDGVDVAYEKPHIHLMQFTGLKDKNGKEIYEGDVVVADVGYGTFNAEVKWMHAIQLYPFNHSDPSECEIIGNIYENPELLK